MLNNQDLRLFAKGKGVALWQVAEFLHVSEPTLTRKLRRELSEEETEEMKKIIIKIGSDTNAC